ncbi:hypothetical protein I302_108535 [Kwoniella bestiolae CBS 10118]|uniref:Major facilitator superfamily (MFS) profile domain-containing protein n=1 Tax=Kwoniella bestiolae CBS 10118 TaxID=1296100 RepID=A0A1B9FVH5_9TREE|nr:hypothetical protein I302_07092 [Kwoniella bestiolae CBS 10118]OCF22751.1 hypothetical protein I302_07092 [Kwoniella bestiolae CBS 10118]
MTTEMNPIELEPKAAIDHLDVIEKTPSAIHDIDNGPSYTHEESMKVRRKMDMYILPVLCFMNVCAFLDKANIGNANTAGMSADLGITKKQYNFLLTIFYVVYTICQPEMLLLKYIPPKFFLTAIVSAWGLASTLQGVTTTYGGMIACRVVIAALEAGGGPAIAFYFTMLYPRQEFGLRWTIFQAVSCIANAFAGAAAYGLVQAKTALAPWKLVFIVESTPTFLSALLIFLVLPSGPDKCAWLSPRENEIARERVERSQSKEPHGGYSIAGFKAAFKEPWTWWIAIIHYCGGMAFNSLSVFLTAIIREMGYTSVNAQGLSAPPYLVAYVIAVVVAYWSDRLSIRGWFIGAANLIGGIGYILIAYVGPKSIRYFAAYITVAGVYVGQPLMFSWCATNADTSSKRAASLVLFLITGQLGSITGSNIYNDPPRYHKGNSICAGGLFLSCILCFTGTYYLQYQNKRKDEKYGAANPDAVAECTADGTDSPNWRFVY